MEGLSGVGKEGTAEGVGGRDKTVPLHSVTSTITFNSPSPLEW